MMHYRYQRIFESKRLVNVSKCWPSSQLHGHMPACTNAAMHMIDSRPQWKITEPIELANVRLLTYSFI